MNGHASLPQRERHSLGDRSRQRCGILHAIPRYDARIAAFQHRRLRAPRFEKDLCSAQGTGDHIEVDLAVSGDVADHDLVSTETGRAEVRLVALAYFVLVLQKVLVETGLHDVSDRYESRDGRVILGDPTHWSIVGLCTDTTLGEPSLLLELLDLNVQQSLHGGQML